jgi:hypothetical protein
MRIKLFFLTLLVLSVGFGTVFAAQELSVEEQAELEGENFNPSVNPSDFHNPEPEYKANSHLKDVLSSQNIFDQKALDNLKSKNAQLKFHELMTYKEYLDTIGQNDFDNAAISPERLVWVSQIYYPEGYEHPRAGFIDNCLRTTVVDAETREILGNSLTNIKATE